jgi:hypothetical protein
MSIFLMLAPAQVREAEALHEVHGGAQEARQSAGQVMMSRKPFFIRHCDY